jgi:hypothetical protein
LTELLPSFQGRCAGPSTNSNAGTTWKAPPAVATNGEVAVDTHERPGRQPAALAEPIVVSDPLRGLLVQLEGSPCGDCGSTIAVIGPGTDTHAGRLECQDCGKFRTWLPRQCACFVTACINAGGRPTEPIILRGRSLTIGDKAMTAPEKGFQTKPNTGALFRDERKSSETDRDYNGTLDINGTEYWLSGWIKQSKKTGKKYLSIAVKSKDAPTQSKPAFDDEIPWA